MATHMSKNTVYKTISKFNISVNLYANKMGRKKENVPVNAPEIVRSSGKVPPKEGKFIMNSFVRRSKRIIGLIL